jgi:hypothetical protein
MRFKIEAVEVLRKGEGGRRRKEDGTRPSKCP